MGIGIDGTSWGWDVSYEGLDPSLNNVYYLSLDSRGNGGNIATSHYFNISDTGTDTPTLSKSNTIPAATQSSSPIPSAPSTVSTSPPALTSTAPPTMTVTQESNGNGAIKAGTVTGIAVGVVLGALLLVGGAGWWAWRFKKRRDTAAALEAGSGGQHWPSDAKSSAQETDGNPIHEVPDSSGRRVFELSTT